MCVGIVDVSIGNLGSLRSSLFNLGWDTSFVAEPSALTDCTHLLLPGVGAFSTAVRRLHDTGLFLPIKKFADEGYPVMGICLGMQLLADTGLEGGYTTGLGLVPGSVIALEAPGLRIPHVGWNNVHQSKSHPLLAGIRSDVDFYFVHSYKFQPTQVSNVIANTEYGEIFPSIVGHGNVVGVQFHPEKSQFNGQKILDNFCQWNGKC